MIKMIIIIIRTNRKIDANKPDITIKDHKKQFMFVD